MVINCTRRIKFYHLKKYSVFSTHSRLYLFFTVFPIAIILSLFVSSCTSTSARQALAIGGRNGIPEPSGAAYSAKDNTLYIVSDNGKLFQTDINGKVKRKASYVGQDFEGVHIQNDTIIVADESRRDVLFFDRNTLKLQRRITIRYNGGRNEGIESITYNKEKKLFLLCTEKNPVILFEYDADFQLKNAIVEPEGWPEVSAMAWHKGYLWFLSDQERTVYLTDPHSYKILRSWKLNVLNPESLTFDNKGNMIIISDDMARLYHFAKPDIPERETRPNKHQADNSPDDSKLNKTDAASADASQE